MKKFFNPNALSVPANCCKVYRMLAKTVLPVLFALLTALFSSVASAQDQQETQDPKIYYLKADQGRSNHWDESGFWYEANGSGTESVRPSEITNSIFVVGNTFHLRTHRPNRDGNYDTTFGYYYAAGSHTNKLYIGYKVDLDAGTVDLNDYGEGVYGVLHLKTQARRPNEGNITVDDLYIGHGEIFQGETNSTINLHGSLTIQGDARIRNVAEDKMAVEDRIFNIYSEIHGSGLLQFESEKTHDNHTSEIYLMSSNNDFSGKVCVESGTHIHIDDPDEEHYYYDYQTHLYLVGENALCNATHVLNEGFMYANANQRFKNYDGDDSFGQFTGVGELIVNPGVNVELLYDNPEFGDEPIGLITVKNENDNPGTLNFNVPEGMTKAITMSEDPADYSKIAGQGIIEKTGDGALQIIAAAEGLVGAESFVVSSGRLDMEGYFTGNLQVGEELPSGDYTIGTFSPGDVVSASINVLGDFDINENSILVFEQDANGMEKLIATNVFIDSDSIIELIMGSERPGKEYSMIVQTSGDFTGDYASNDFWNSLLSDASVENWTVSVRDNTVYATIKGEPIPAVPEPSTWALLILGVAGLLYVRKRVRS
ncbi:MAG: PEP-CTERM sorting domain-containing protein [Thermoguttaceae bacterium]|nr:PEP-CTERM sorting domain-containing protein [Thermoguttaceae bacterium]